MKRNIIMVTTVEAFPEIIANKNSMVVMKTTKSGINYFEVIYKNTHISKASKFY